MMLVVWLVVVATLVAGLLLLTLGRGEGLRRADLAVVEPDLPDGRLTAEDVEGVRLPLALRGYRMDVVDDLLDRLVAELTARDEELAAIRPGATFPGSGGPGTRRGGR